MQVMTIRLNKNNRDEIKAHAIQAFRKVARQRNNFISIIDIWNVEFELQNMFNISDYASQQIVQQILEEYKY
tara:strand:- start:1931 stop:2146 length:216 start_codon:yes stop_codon:yes gene_type:complete